MKDTGRRIKRVTMPFYGPNGEQGTYTITPGPGLNDFIVLDGWSMGDHDESWIRIFKDGIEVKRISAYYAIAIEWEIPENTDTDEREVG